MKTAVVLMVLALMGCKQKAAPIPVQSAGVPPGYSRFLIDREVMYCKDLRDLLKDCIRGQEGTQSTEHVAGAVRFSMDGNPKWAYSESFKSASKPVEQFGFGRTFRDFAGKEWHNDGKRWKKLPEGCILENSKEICGNQRAGTR